MIMEGLVAPVLQRGVKNLAPSAKVAMADALAAVTMDHVRADAHKHRLIGLIWFVQSILQNGRDHANMKAFQK
jgi:hypothetical protein